MMGVDGCISRFRVGDGMRAGFGFGFGMYCASGLVEVNFTCVLWTS